MACVSGPQPPNTPSPHEGERLTTPTHIQGPHSGVQQLPPRLGRHTLTALLAHGTQLPSCVSRRDPTGFPEEARLHAPQDEPPSQLPLRKEVDFSWTAHPLGQRNSTFSKAAAGLAVHMSSAEKSHSHHPSRPLLPGAFPCLERRGAGRR